MAVVSGKCNQFEAVYRCDVCGRTGFWHETRDGMKWRWFGGIEPDGNESHMCSDECRRKIKSDTATRKAMEKRGLYLPQARAA